MTLTIFGASGDLAKLKIFPSIYRLAEFKRLPDNYAIVGFARSSKTREEFQAEFAGSVRAAYGDSVKEAVLADLLNHCWYFAGQYNDVENFKAYRDFLKTIPGFESRLTHLAYFSVPSLVYKDIIANLAAIYEKNDDLRLIIEKPFGTSTGTARELFHFASQYFAEEKFYLLDHYLGKTAVRSILRLRESNRILSHMMHGHEISNIQITAFEPFGVKERAGYFDQVGMLKDMVQSHLLQLLALLTMSLPITQDYESLQRERETMLGAMHFSGAKRNIVFGQYDSYAQEKDIPAKSETETFVALRLLVNRLDWHRVPFYIRTGKMIGKQKSTYAVVELKKFDFQKADEKPNRIIFEFFPEERITVKLVNRVGETESYQDLSLTQSIFCSLEEGCLPEYATLILDVLRGEKKFFLSFPEIIAQWKIIDGIKNGVELHDVPPEKYSNGSTGPISQNELPASDGYSWYEV
ncbi:MAG: hypothetical protein WCJ29_01160 [bacterium]